MLSEERIRLMARMAAYEEGEGKNNINVGNYFQSDYVSLKMLSSFLGATLAFAIGVAVMVLYEFESFMKDIYQIDLLETGKSLLVAYVVFVGVYCLISFFYYSYKYIKAKKNLKLYQSHLQELLSLYEL